MQIVVNEGGYLVFNRNLNMEGRVVGLLTVTHNPTNNSYAQHLSHLTRFFL